MPMGDSNAEVRHFLDLDALPVETLRKIIETSKALKRGDFPNAEAYYERALTLPLYPRMSDDEQDKVVAALARATA